MVMKVTGPQLCLPVGLQSLGSVKVCSGPGNQSCPYPKSHSRLCPHRQNWGPGPDELELLAKLEEQNR